MIDGVKIVEILGENKDVVKYSYNGYMFYSKKKDFDKLTKEDVELEYKDACKIFKELNDIKKGLPPPTEEDLSLFERWQSETGYDENFE